METAKGRRGKGREEKTYLSIRCMQRRAEREYGRYSGKERKAKDCRCVIYHIYVGMMLCSWRRLAISCHACLRLDGGLVEIESIGN